jgi:hypothetical protein
MASAMIAWRRWTWSAVTVSGLSAVAMRPVQVPGAAPGVVGDWHQPGRGGQVPRAGERAQITCGDEQAGAEDRAESGHRLDARRVWVLLEGLRDLLVERLHALVEGQEVARQLGDDGRGDVLSCEAPQV